MQDLNRLNKDEGMTVADTAFYKNPQGKIIKLSAICPHAGCRVSWNDNDKSWDCPCHGSRFDQQGKVIHGPATENMKNL